MIANRLLESVTVSVNMIAGMLLIAILSATAALAEDRPWPPIKRSGLCLEASDGCQICTFDSAGGLIDCSTPGIACQPQEWQCRQPKAALDQTPLPRRKRPLSTPGGAKN